MQISKEKERLYYCTLSSITDRVQAKSNPPHFFILRQPETSSRRQQQQQRRQDAACRSGRNSPHADPSRKSLPSIITKHEHKRQRILWPAPTSNWAHDKLHTSIHTRNKQTEISEHPLLHPAMHLVWHRRSRTKQRQNHFCINLRPPVPPLLFPPRRSWPRRHQEYEDPIQCQLSIG